MTNPQRRDPAVILPEITFDAIAPPYPRYSYFDGVESYPFRRRATAFDMVNAWWLIEASTLAYAEEDFVHPRFQKAGLTEVKFFTGNGTQCFVANNDEFAVIVFRGTEIRRREGKSDYRNIIADLKTDADIILTDSGRGGKVHKGFKDALDEVWVKKGLLKYIKTKDTSNRTIWFTGHSLGAALATLAAERYGNVQGLYTFGSPRVGDIDFADRFHINAYRFVNNNDIVARVPPPILYKHVGNLRYIDSSGIVHDDSSLLERITDAIRGDISYIFNSSGQIKPEYADFMPDCIVDHVPTLYATHIWNNIT
ncbi:MAG: lipase family protein [Syntrophales bacterium]|jgi:triacylglycerol lipase